MEFRSKPFGLYPLTARFLLSSESTITRNLPSQYPITSKLSDLYDLPLEENLVFNVLSVAEDLKPNFGMKYEMRRTKVRQQSSAAAQMKRSSYHHLFVSQDEIDRHMKGVFDLVARRAYQLFENRGGEHGHDSEDWFRAESEIFEPINIEMGDPGDAYTAFAVVSGYRPEDLKISAESRRLIICGLCCPENTDSTSPLGESQRAGRFYFCTGLPTEVDTAGVSAKIKNNVLEVRLPKALQHVEPPVQ